MKLHTLTDQDLPELLNEAPRSTQIDDPITRPFGISREEFTPEYQARLKRYQKTRPNLYHKIMTGS